MPGTSKLSLLVQHAHALENHYGTRVESYVEIWDSDTNEVLTRLPLSVQSVMVPSVFGAKGELAWTLTIDVFH